MTDSTMTTDELFDHSASTPPKAERYSPVMDAVRDEVIRLSAKRPHRVLLVQNVVDAMARRRMTVHHTTIRRVLSELVVEGLLRPGGRQGKFSTYVPTGTPPKVKEPSLREVFQEVQSVMPQVEWRLADQAPERPTYLVKLDRLRQIPKDIEATNAEIRALNDRVNALLDEQKLLQTWFLSSDEIVELRKALGLE